MPKQETVALYRVENPTIPAEPNGVTSHADLVGQWFTPDLKHAVRYIRKNTQTFGLDGGPVNGAQLVIAQMPKDKLDEHHVSRHPVASTMDFENDNYIVPRNGSIPMEGIPLDETIEDLKGQLGDVAKLIEAQRRITELVDSIGRTSVES